MKAIIYQSVTNPPRVEAAQPDPGVPYPDNTSTPQANWAWAKRAAFAACLAPTLFFSNTVGNATFPESVPGKVSVSYPDKVYDVRRNQYLYPSWMENDNKHLADPKFVSVGEMVASKSYHPDKIFDSKRIQYSYPSMMVIDTKQMTVPEKFDMTKWTPEYPDFVNRVKDYRWVYPEIQKIIPPTTLTDAGCTTYRPPTGLNSSVDAGPASDFTQMYVSNDTRSSFNAVNDQATLQNFGDFGLPAGAVINGIKVRVEGLLVGAGVNHTVSFYILKDSTYWAGGNSNFSPTSTGSDEIQDLGGATNLWGTTGWTAAHFADGTLRVRATMSSLSATSVDIDYFEVSVCYSIPSWDEVGIHNVTAVNSFTVGQPNPRDVARRQWSYPYAWFDPYPIPTAPETITIDKYAPMHPDKLFDLKRMQYTYPYAWFDPLPIPLPSPEQAVPTRQTAIPLFRQKEYRFMFPHFSTDPKFMLDAERVSLDKFPPQYPSKIFDVKRQQYLYPTVAYNINPIGQPADTQLPALYQTPIPNFYQRRQQYTYPEWAANDNKHLSDAIFLAMHWQPSYPNKIFDVVRKQYTYPSFSPVDISHMSDLETINMDKWFRETARPVFDLKRLQYTYPTLFRDNFPNSGTAEFTDRNPDKWQPRTNMPVFDLKRIQYAYPSFFVDLKQLTQKETVSYDRFQPQYPAKIWDVKRQQFLYPSSFMVLTASQVYPVGLLPTWMPKYPDKIFDIKRMQWSYPTLFYYDGLTIVPCPPLTDWEAPDGAPTTDWEAIAANATDWEKAAPQATGWSKAAPASTDWEPNAINSTDWEPKC